MNNKAELLRNALATVEEGLGRLSITARAAGELASYGSTLSDAIREWAHPTPQVHELLSALDDFHNEFPLRAVELVKRVEVLESAFLAVRDTTYAILVPEFGAFKVGPNPLLQKATKAIERWEEYRATLYEMAPLLDRISTESAPFGELCAEGKRLLAAEAEDGGDIPGLPIELGRDYVLRAAVALPDMAGRCQVELNASEDAASWAIDELQRMSQAISLAVEVEISTLYGPPPSEGGATHFDMN